MLLSLWEMFGKANIVETIFLCLEYPRSTYVGQNEEVVKLSDHLQHYDRQERYSEFAEPKTLD